MVTLTDKAVGKLKTLLEQDGKPDYGLRLKVVGGGCSGMSYAMDFEEKPAPGDNTYEQSGVKVFVDPQSEQYVNGAIVDYTEALTGAGFTIKNPNAKGGCGCGSSFTV
ncbi:MAG: iron-sulfur cluster insertion protein ErpA [Candidatus Omnitrophica bacterium]|nr:iron-sulfur cluster insertion protein ErpA [Candidatus Omnitrophota bacterium]